jgi:hypothetical protein
MLYPVELRALVGKLSKYVGSVEWLVWFSATDPADFCDLQHRPVLQLQRHEAQRASLRHRRASPDRLWRSGHKPASVLCSVSFMPDERGTPARSRFLTAVRRKSRTSLPGTPATQQSDADTFPKSPIRSPLGRQNAHGIIRPTRCSISRTYSRYQRAPT